MRHCAFVPWFVGQLTLAGMLACSTGLCWMLTSPPTCGQEAVPAALWQFTPWLLASGAPIVSNSKPDEAVLSLCMMVLLTMLAANVA